MTEYKITIIDSFYDTFIYTRQSKYDNFFTALEHDLKDIEEIICSDGCIEYDWERVG